MTRDEIFINNVTRLKEIANMDKGTCGGCSECALSMNNDCLIIEYRNDNKLYNIVDCPGVAREILTTVIKQQKIKEILK